MQSTALKKTKTNFVYLQLHGWKKFLVDYRNKQVGDVNSNPEGVGKDVRSVMLWPG